MFRSHDRVVLAILAALSLVVLGSSDLQSQGLPPQYLPVFGGTGGTSFSRDCGAGRVLTGFRYRSGLVIDAIGLLCKPVLANGTLGPESTVGTIAGGSGGTTEVKSCGANEVVHSLTVYSGSYVSYLVIGCLYWDSAKRKFFGVAYPSMSFHIGNSSTLDANHGESCDSPSQPGSGLRGRSGAFIDAIGLVCDEP